MIALGGGLEGSLGGLGGSLGDLWGVLGRLLEGLWCYLTPTWLRKATRELKNKTAGSDPHPGPKPASTYACSFGLFGLCFFIKTEAHAHL